MNFNFNLKPGRTISKGGNTLFISFFGLLGLIIINIVSGCGPSESTPPGPLPPPQKIARPTAVELPGQPENKPFNKVYEAESTITVNDDDIVGSYDHGKITVADVKELVQNLKQGFNQFPPQEKRTTEWRKNLVKEVVLNRELVQMAEKEQLDKTKDFQNMLKKTRQQTLMSKLYQEEIVKDEGNISEADIEKYYEENKERFKGRGSYSIRHIFFDTVHTQTEKEKQAKRKKAEAALAKLKAGADFIKITEEYSDLKKDPTALITIPMGAEPSDFNLLPEIEITALSLNEGEISDIIPTENGYEIIKLEKLDPGYRPLDEVKDYIKNLLVNEARTKKAQAFVEEAKKRGKAEEHFELLDDPKAKGDQVVAKVFDSVLTVDEAQEMLDSIKEFRPELVNDPERRNQYLRDDFLRSEALVHIAIEKGLDKDQEVIKKIEATRNKRLTDLMLEKLLEEKMNITEERLKEEYEKNKDRFRTPKKIKAREIRVFINVPEGVSRTTKDTAMRQTHELAMKICEELEAGADFGEMVQKYSQAESKADDGWVMSKEFFAQGPMGRRFDMGVWPYDKGEVTCPPIELRNGWLIAKVEDVLEPKYKEYEEVKDSIKRMLVYKERDKLKQEVMDEIAQKLNLQIDVEKVRAIDLD